MKTLLADTVNSPIGKIVIVVDGSKLVFLDFEENQERKETLLRRRFGEYRLQNSPGALSMEGRLSRYFDGDRSAFNSIACSTGGTDFQRSVWTALTEIPWGKAISYDQLANDIGNPKAVRAAASANAKNPISILIPCHRVIGKNGTIRGYAGGEARKVWLLQHEGAII